MNTSTSFDTWSPKSNSVDNVFDQYSQPLSCMTTNTDTTWLDSIVPKVEPIDTLPTSPDSVNGNFYFNNNLGFNTELDKFCNMTRSTIKEEEFFSSACASGSISPSTKIGEDSSMRFPDPIDLNNKLEVIKKSKDLTPKSLESIFDTKEVLKDANRIQNQQNSNSEINSTITGIKQEGSKRKRSTRKKLTESQKQAHNKIEKKYRININTKIAGLQKIIPSVASEKTAFETGFDKKDDNDCLSQRLNKSIILERATNYILHLQEREKKLEKEVNDLKMKVTYFGDYNIGIDGQFRI